MSLTPSMLIFATNHDESTAESIQLAQSIIDEKDKTLLGKAAVRQTLLSCLETSEQQSLMIFSHGEKHRFIGNDGESAFTTEDVALLAHRKSFVYACWTAIQLGKTAAKQPSCWYAGYNNAVVTGGSDIPNEMQQIFRFIKNNFQALENKEDIDLFLQALATICNRVEEYYLEKYPESLDYIGIATVLRNIWAKLEIWTANEKFTHPEAIEAPLW